MLKTKLCTCLAHRKIIWRVHSVIWFELLIEQFYICKATVFRGVINDFSIAQSKKLGIVNIATCTF